MRRAIQFKRAKDWIACITRKSKKKMNILCFILVEQFKFEQRNIQSFQLYSGIPGAFRSYDKYITHYYY